MGHPAIVTIPLKPTEGLNGAPSHRHYPTQAKERLEWGTPTRVPGLITRFRDYGDFGFSLELCLLLLIWNAPVVVLMSPLKRRRRFARFVQHNRRGRFMFGMTCLR
jgi:hypothetical protein